MKRWWKQELLVVAAIIVVVLLTIFSVHMYNQSIMVHATNIEQGSVYLKYEDKTIDKKLSSQEVKTICSIIDGKKLNTQQIDTYFDENKQIVLGDSIHLYISGTCSCLLYEEKNAHFSLTGDEQTQIESILEKYGYASEY